MPLKTQTAFLLVILLAHFVYQIVVAHCVITSCDPLGCINEGSITQFDAARAAPTAQRELKP